MREPSLVRASGQRTPGVIDTISAGYGIVNRQIWIILIPILLDLLLWLGPQVSMSPLVGQALTRMELLPGLSAENAEAVEQARRGMMAAADEFNLLWLLSPSLIGAVAVPSAAALFSALGPLQFVDTWVAALLVLGGATLVGLALGSGYHVLLAQQLRDGAISAERALWQSWAAWRRVLALLLLLMGVAAAIGLPLAFVLALVGMLSPGLASMGVAVVMVTLIWVQLHLYFAPSAIFVGQRRPIQAVRESFGLMRTHFWSAMGLIALIWVILLGMAQVWVMVAALPGGALLGILGNAYIASGLAAAGMVFYQERIGAKEKALG